MHPETNVIVQPASDDPIGARLITTQAYRCGDVICPLPCHSIVTEPTYLTIQIGPGRHIDQVGVLGYMNHSCAPSAIINIAARAVIANRDLMPGEELTFFYPSTEWEMARPFACRCGAPACLGWIAGAKDLSPEQRCGYFFNGHIRAQFARPTVAAEVRWEVLSR